MAYADVSVIVDGALEQEERFFDETLLREFVCGVEEDARGDGYPTQVYVLYHEHEPSDEECSCAQYVTDHHPTYSYNTEEE